MAIISAEFELGTDQATIATGDAGNATAWNTVTIPASGTCIYDVLRAAHGTKSAKIATAGTAGICGLLWSTALGTVTDHWGRLYLYMTANPAANYILVAVNSGGTDASRVAITTLGKLQVARTGGAGPITSTASIALNQWVRIEFHAVHNSTTGTIEAKLFNTPDSSAADDTIITLAGNTLASADRVRFGLSSVLANIGPFWIDAALAGATSYPGPFPVNTVAPVVSGSTPVGSVLSTTNGTWNITPSSVTYQWTRNGSNIGGATSSTYTTVTADAGTVVGCTVTAVGVISIETATQASSNTIAVDLTIVAPATTLNISSSAPAITLAIISDASTFTTTSVAPGLQTVVLPSAGILTPTSVAPAVIYSGIVIAPVARLSLVVPGDQLVCSELLPNSETLSCSEIRVAPIPVIAMVPGIVRISITLSSIPPVLTTVTAVPPAILTAQSTAPGIFAGIIIAAPVGVLTGAIGDALLLLKLLPTISSIQVVSTAPVLSQSVSAPIGSLSLVTTAPFVPISSLVVSPTNVMTISSVSPVLRLTLISGASVTTLSTVSPGLSTTLFPGAAILTASTTAPISRIVLFSPAPNLSFTVIVPTFSKLILVGVAQVALPSISVILRLTLTSPISAITISSVGPQFSSGVTSPSAQLTLVGRIPTTKTFAFAVTAVSTRIAVAPQFSISSVPLAPTLVLTGLRPRIRKKQAVPLADIHSLLSADGIRVVMLGTRGRE